MSTSKIIKRLTAPQIQARKGGEPLVALTAYQAYSARIADTHCDILLVGDSVGMIVYGYESTLAVSVDMMIAHGRAVVSHSRRALVVVDMPFGSYEQNPQQAFANAARIIAETGCGAVKLEGGTRMAETVTFLCQRGIPVMGHIGLTPQAMNSLGGFKTQGHRPDEKERLVRDAQALEAAGAFCVVIEGVVEPLAVALTQAVSVPTIGIGASAQCDGQILVMEDMLGYNNRVPKFVRRYGAFGTLMEDAIKAYSQDVKTRTFPSQAETYNPKP
ncbi:3-methyl-2-oxobutanoate hydroxymethyltransferase [Bartonella sp. DGB2]|uniref:3-methyl-2-oxobutanoate hydroxymethyltransferase n=1 Tax=Bartonella sp. DGB2 TaxID=3388426 RepID=UPI00398FDB72